MSASSQLKLPVVWSWSGTLIFLASLSGWLILVLADNLGAFRATGTAADFDFPRSNLPQKLTPLAIPRDASLSANQELNIRFRFRIDEASMALAAEGTEPYGNLFQTGDGDRGVRIEMDLRHGRDGRWGLASARGGHIDLGRRPLPNRWYLLELRIADRKASVLLNGQQILKAAVLNSDPSLDQVWSGSGYSLSRPFPGQIQDFSVVVKLHREEIEQTKLFLIALAAAGSAVWLGGCAMLIVRRHPWRGEIRLAVWTAAAAVYLWLFFLLKQAYGELADLDYLRDTLFFFAMFVLIVAVAGQFNNRARRCLGLLAVTVNYLCFLVLATGAAYLERRGTSAEPGLSFDDVGALYQTNPREIFEFFWSYFSTADRALLILLPLLASASLFVLFRTSRIAMPRNMAYALAGVGLITVHLQVSANHGIAATVFSALEAHSEAAQEFEQYRLLRKNTPPIRATKSEKGETYVLVIGESASRDHFSAYGYFRPTTPWLDSLTDHAQWTFFRNAYSSHVHTVPSLLQALTASNQYADRGSFSAPSIIEVASAAGFNTVWLSEQGVSWTDTPLNAMASSSRSVRFVKPVGSIIGAFRETMSQLDPKQNNFIVVHLLGSHADYRDRVPTGYSVEFSGTRDDLGNFAKDQRFLRNLLDPYDRSIHYTDSLLREIHSTITRHAAPVHALMFVSDHGEDVFGQGFHNASKFTFAMARIPMLLFVSEDWAKRYPSRNERFRLNQNRIFTLDLLFDTMIGTMGTVSEYRNAAFDLGSSQYSIDDDNAMTMKRDRDFQSGLYPDAPVRLVRQDPYLVAIENNRILYALHGDKFIADRADIRSRASEAFRLGFPGMEINVAVPSGHIGHYPESVHQRKLDDFLKLPEIALASRLWFDLKLEQGHKLAEALDDLEKLDREFKLKTRVVLESSESGLLAYSKLGWHTTYYINERGWPGCLASDKQMSQCALQIAKIAKSEEVKGISFPSTHYRFVKTKLEPLLPPHVVYHTFGFDGLSVFDPGLTLQLPKIPATNDPRVHSILLESSQTFFEGL